MAYEFNGSKYEQASSHQKAWGAKLVRDLNLEGKERILDLGCGDGAITIEIAEYLPRGEVIGVDASQGMIEAARQKKAGNVEFVKMDINNLKLRERFDVIFSNATLHWIKDHKTLLDNVGRILRPGGIVRFNFAGEGNCSHLVSVIREAMALEDYAESFSGMEWPWFMPSVAEYRAVIEASDFSGADVWGENEDRYFPDKNSLTLWIEQPSLVPFIAQLPDSKKKTFRNYVVRRMAEETGQGDGKFFETFRRISVRAQKNGVPGKSL